jgi:hypothetical protein
MYNIISKPAVIENKLVAQPLFSVENKNNSINLLLKAKVDFKKEKVPSVQW